MNKANVSFISTSNVALFRLSEYHGNTFYFQGRLSRSIDTLTKRRPSHKSIMQAERIESNSEQVDIPLSSPLPNGNPRTLHKYKPAEYLHRIHSYAPSHRLHLCMRPTPIQPFTAPSPLYNADKGVNVYLKRDDLSHCGASGNKIRKLEFILADAISKGYTSIITAGGIQSNHARTVSILSRELSLDPHIFLRCSSMKQEPNIGDLGNNGNVLLHRMMGSKLYLVKKMSYLTGLLPKMKQVKEDIENENASKKAYLVPIGGSDEVGVWGYIDAYNEIINSSQHKNLTHIALSTGSGGTAAGLSIANYLNGQPLKIVAFTVSDDANYFYNHIDEMLTHLNLIDEVSARQIITIIESKGAGYGINSESDMLKCQEISKATGIIFDPTYTLKGVLGMLKEIDQPNSVFERGSNVVFIHTGGLFAMFDRRIEPYLDDSSISLC